MTQLIEDPPEEAKKNRSTLTFLYSRIRSNQFVIITFIILLLLGTILYFEIKNEKWFQKEQVEEVQILPSEKVIGKIINAQQEEAKPTVAELPVVKPLDNENPNEWKMANSGIKEKEKELATDLSQNSEGDISGSLGGVFLRSPIKNMSCVVGENSLSVSCCGLLSLSEDVKEDSIACTLMDTYKVHKSGKDERHYRLRFTLGTDIIMYEESTGFPEPGGDCYPIPGKPVRKICGELDYVGSEEDFADDTKYETCTFINFNTLRENFKGSVSENQIKNTSYVRNIGCDTTIKALLKGSPSLGIMVIKMHVVSPNVNNTKAQVKESSTPSSEGTDIKMKKESDKIETGQSKTDVGNSISAGDTRNPTNLDSSTSASSSESLSTTASSEAATNVHGKTELVPSDGSHRSYMRKIFESILNFFKNTGHVIVRIVHL